MMTILPTIHASAVLVGSHAVLIRGSSGTGKSRLALDLMDAADRGLLRFARLVGDDRVHVEAVHGRLLVWPAQSLAGLIEVRGLGVLRVPHEPLAQVGLLVDLAADDAERMPEDSARTMLWEKVSVPRLPVAAGAMALPLVLATLRGYPQTG